MPYDLKVDRTLGINIMEPEYDEDSCITAGELRSRGYKLPDDIPDVAWVPTSSIQISVVKGVWM